MERSIIILNGHAGPVELGRRSLFHAVTSIAQVESAGTTIFTNGRACEIKDVTGRAFLDMVAGLWCVNGLKPDIISLAKGLTQRLLPDVLVDRFRADLVGTA